MTQADHVIQMSLQVWIRSSIYVPFLSFEMSGFLASGSVPSWISKLEFSLRGDFGLFIGCTVWTTDCSLPVQSCKRVHAHLLYWTRVHGKMQVGRTLEQKAHLCRLQINLQMVSWPNYVKNYNRWDRTKFSLALLRDDPWQISTGKKCISIIW